MTSNPFAQPPSACLHRWAGEFRAQSQGTAFVLGEAALRSAMKTLAAQVVQHVREITRWILSWGSKAKVLGPSELKQRVAREVEAMMDKK